MFFYTDVRVKGTGLSLCSRGRRGEEIGEEEEVRERGGGKGDEAGG